MLYCMSSVLLPAELVEAVRYHDQRQVEAERQTPEKSEAVRERLAFLQLQSQVSAHAVFMFSSCLESSQVKSILFV